MSCINYGENGSEWDEMVQTRNEGNRFRGSDTIVMEMNVDEKKERKGRWWDV